jgi:hypothetical protein
MSGFSHKIFPATRLGYFLLTLLAVAGFIMFVLTLIRAL